MPRSSKAQRRPAVIAGPITAESLPVREKSPKNSPSFSGGESATSMTRLTVHVPPRATPTRGPESISIHGARAAEASRIATIHTTSTPTSVFFGPILSEACPEPTLPTTAKTVEKRRRLRISPCPIPKTSRPYSAMFAIAVFAASVYRKVATMNVPIPP